MFDYRMITRLLGVLICYAAITGMSVAQTLLGPLATVSIKEISLGQTKEDALAALSRSFNVSRDKIECARRAFGISLQIERCLAIITSDNATYAGIPVGAAAVDIRNDQVVRISLILGIPNQSKHQTIAQNLTAVFGEPIAKSNDVWNWAGNEATLQYRLGKGGSTQDSQPIELDLIEKKYLIALLNSSESGAIAEKRRKSDM